MSFVELPIFFMKIGICVFFENLSRKFKYNKNVTTVTVLYLQTDIHVGSYLAQSFLE